MWRVLQELILLISTLLRDKIFQGTVLGIVVTHDFEILLAKISELMLEKGFGKQLNANASNLNQSLYQIGSKGNPFWNDTPSIKIYLQFLKHFVLVREHTGTKSGTRAKQALWWMEDFPSLYHSTQYFFARSRTGFVLLWSILPGYVCLLSLSLDVLLGRVCSVIWAG